MANAYAAGAAGLPFAVLRGYIGSDLPRSHPNIRSVTCPFTGERLAAVPALRPDVGDHPRAAGRPRGQRAASRGIIGVQKEAVLAARRAIVTVEEIVEDLAAASPNAVVLPALDRRRGSARCPAARAPPTRRATTGATTPSTPPGTRSPATATAFRAWMREHVLRARRRT